MSSILIRPAVLEDAPVLCHLMTQLGYPVAEQLLLTRLKVLLEHPDAAHWVAEETHRGVVGIISMHFIPQLPLSGDFARISYLCVDADARGRGVGQRLLARAELLALERGCERIELHCHARRTGAHAFYQHCGFEDAPRYFCKRLQ